MRNQRLIRSLVLACAAVSGWLLDAPWASAQGVPVIEQVEPTSGPPGTVVNVIGRRFSPDTKVSLGTQPLPIVVSLPNRISVRIPEGVQSDNIAVVTASGTVRGPEFRITPPPPVPSIESIDPQKGPPGSHVTIHGKHFSALLTGNVVTLSGQPVVVRSATPDTLDVIVPAVPSGGPFMVRVQQAGEAASKVSFEVMAATSITELAPPRGGPGSELTIRGHGFSTTAKQNRVYLNNAPLTVKSATESRLVVQLPAKVASGKILVDVQGAGRAYSAEPFVVQRPPTVLELTPERGAPGASVTLRGTNFGTDPEVVEVKLGETKLLVREARDTSLRVEVTEGAHSDKLSVRVHGVGPGVSRQSFTVLPVLKITGFEPETGAPGSEVTISGQGFSDKIIDNRVSIGGQAARVTEASSTQLKVRVPKAKSGPIQIAVSGNAEIRTTAPFVIAEASAAAPEPAPTPASPAHATPAPKKPH
jgi:hypothetical protein